MLLQPLKVCCTSDLLSRCMYVVSQMDFQLEYLIDTHLAYSKIVRVQLHPVFNLAGSWQDDVIKEHIVEIKSHQAQRGVNTDGCSRWDN